MGPIQPPIGLNFGKQVGMLFAGHSIFIPGKPNAFTPLLSKHFMMVETAMRTPADALYFSHTISTYFSYPNRTDLVAICNQDAQTRLKASIFWGKYLSSSHDFNDHWAIIMRFGFLLVHLATLFPWFVVSSCAPGLVHQVLATGADVTWKKYETTMHNAPDYKLYQNHIAEMQRLTTAHQQAANTAYFCPFTCFIALFWLLIWRMRPSAATAAPGGGPSRSGSGGYGGGGNVWQAGMNAGNPSIGPAFNQNFGGPGMQ